MYRYIPISVDQSGSIWFIESLGEFMAKKQKLIMCEGKEWLDDHRELLVSFKRLSIDGKKQGNEEKEKKRRKKKKIQTEKMNVGMDGMVKKAHHQHFGYVSIIAYHIPARNNANTPFIYHIHALNRVLTLISTAPYAYNGLH